ncbi:MAG: glycerol kinase GlpK [Acidobacteriota bacterium]|nr:glycerol kinase GlpK [Blastocatellia bacterium]MDW8240434.1 glycerol kinase GlpK [Acidobacteriota bacterium]
MKPTYVLALDQGTTSSRAILFDRQGVPVAIEAEPLRQIYPQPGWVEHDPNEIWRSQLTVARRVLQNAGVTPSSIAAIGTTNQRETTIVWDRQTGMPIANAIVWQCRRTAPLCEELKRSGVDQQISEKTGLPMDAYFSATKLRWILDHVPNARARAEAGDLLFGTVDSWLIYQLSGGRLHITDPSNASRTLLFNIHERRWDDELLAHFDIPRHMLPEVRSSSAYYGEACADLLGAGIPLAGCAGDQQAALFGQACFEAGMVKNTYGTGCFVLMTTGSKAIASSSGLLTTVAWELDGQLEYALEGSVFVAGAALQWLRDRCKFFVDMSETEAMARSVPDTGGVFFVPAFVGLGAPYWDMQARGVIVGLTQVTEPAHIVRAALEAMAYQSRDVLECLQADAAMPIKSLRVDGGASANNFLCQFQADILGLPVERASVQETTALGAALLAGLAVGFWGDKHDVASLWRADRIFTPAMSANERDKLYAAWKQAVVRAGGWSAVVM